MVFGIVLLLFLIAHSDLVERRDTEKVLPSIVGTTDIRSRKLDAWRLLVGSKFRRVNGHLQLPALRAWLDATITAVAPSKEDAG